MLINFFALLESTVIVGQDPGSEAAAAVGDAASNAAQVSGYDPSGIVMIGFYAVILGALWFFMLRPQRKRDKQIKEMQASIRAGDNIITSAGFYGKVVSVGEDCFIVEFGMNRGIRIPVRKSDVIGIKSPTIGAPIPAEST